MPTQQIVSPLRGRRRILLITATGTLVAASLALLFFARPRDEATEEPAPTPPPRVEALSEGIATYPGTDAATRIRLAGELEDFFVDLYTRAFLEGPAATSINHLFTPDAHEALAASSEIFELGSREALRHGVVRFDGAVTLDGDQVRGALLNVRFVASGLLEPDTQDDPDEDDEDPPPPRWLLQIRQSGELLLLRFEEGWRVAGFDTHLEVDRTEIGSADDENDDAAQEER